MRIACFLLAFLSLVVQRSAAHDLITTKLTYSRDVSRIFAKRCVSCHGETASIPLTSYAQVRPWAVGIKEQVLARRMPPWGAVKGFGNISDDRGLTEEELLTIAFWVVGGAPEGDSAALQRRNAIDVNTTNVGRLRDAISVNQSAHLSKDLLLAGIRPEPTNEVETARVFAVLPNGRKEPIVWLSHFDPKWKQEFRLRVPLNLPAGTVVQSDTPLRFSLETR